MKKRRRRKTFSSGVGLKNH